MGGTALGYQSRRITTEELNALVRELVEYFPELSLRPVISYRNKADHGDIDLVAVADSGLIRRAIDARLPGTDRYDNGPYTSFNYKGVQVDVIAAQTPKEQQLLLDYTAWNDLGNFIGRVARSLGFKYGHNGLMYVLRLSDHAVSELLVSDDTAKIYEFLGYDYQRWLAGFDTREDVFDFAMSTPFFNSTYFSLENQSHQDRVRNKKRKMYQAFLEYIATKRIAPKPKLTPEQLTEQFIRANDWFGTNIIGRVGAALVEYNAKQQLARKFNGELVRSWLGDRAPNGKEFGALLAGFRESRGMEFSAYLEGTSNEQIQRDFIDYHNTR